MAGVLKNERTLYYKYESIRIEWIMHFQKHHIDADLVLIVKRFFDNFHENHKWFQYAVGKIFDGTTHVLVYSDNYRQIKEELEKKTGEVLPEVSFVSDVNLIKERLTFQYPQGKSYRTLSMSLKVENDEIKRRKKQEAEKHASELDTTLQTRDPGRLMAFDVEVHEHDRSVLLEIGFVKTTLTNPEDKQFFHYIIEDNIHIKNKDHVPDNRERFQFGDSQRMSLKDAAETFQKQIADVDLLITHSGSHDEEYLAKYGVSLAGKPMFDTQILALGLMPRGPHVRSLKRLLSDLAIPFDEDVLHNAGNDAAYTMQVFLALKGKLKMESLRERERLEEEKKKQALEEERKKRELEEEKQRQALEEKRKKQRLEDDQSRQLLEELRKRHKLEVEEEKEKEEEEQQRRTLEGESKKQKLEEEKE